MKRIPRWLRILLWIFGIPTAFAIVAVFLLVISMRHDPYDSKRSVETWARILRAATQNWQASTGQTTCPTVRQLIEEKHLDPDTSTLDAWGKPFVLECRSDEIYVTSLGPDGKLGTKDDIRVPKAQP